MNRLSPLIPCLSNITRALAGSRQCLYKCQPLWRELRERFFSTLLEGDRCAVGTIYGDGKISQIRAEKPVLSERDRISS